MLNDNLTLQFIMQDRQRRYNLMLSFLVTITSTFALGIAADTDYINTGDETLTMKNITCGVIRHKNTGNCVTVPGKGDEPRYLSLTDDCTEDKNIFCYDSESRFVRLQDDTDTNICVTKYSNNLLLENCSDGKNVNWIYLEDGTIKSGSNPVSFWEFDSQSNVRNSSGCKQEFYFQLMKYGEHQEQNINMKTEEIVIKMKHKQEHNQRLQYRFHIVLDFLTTNENSSIGQIRLQIRSLFDKTNMIKVIDWRNSERDFSVCSLNAQLAKLAAGTADLILTLDTSGNLRAQTKDTEPDDGKPDVHELEGERSDSVSNVEDTSCEAGFLQRADKVVLQWMNLGYKDKDNPADLFTVTYQLWRNFNFYAGAILVEGSFFRKKISDVITRRLVTS
ncbi:hypothetical protein ACHWQZ_G019528 [Mnemiopsis leidyi]